MIKNQYSFNRICSIILGLFLISGITYYGYDELWPHKWRYKQMSEKEFKSYKISNEKALGLYQLMKDVNEILGKYKVTYWIEGGTLLGAIRHSGLIPFDDDLDIEVSHKDEIILQSALKDLESYGYKTYHRQIYSICKSFSYYSKICIDIFITHNDNGKILFTNIEARKKFPNSYFFENELFPLKKYKFGELELWGPNNAKNYLDRQYPEWDKYIIIQQPHSYHVWLSNIEKKTKFIISDELLKPAMPIGPLSKRISW